MGTRALTRVYDEQDRLILCMYSQFDGYPSGLGQMLHKALGQLKLVNGIGDDRLVANGMGCFAAQLVCAVKDGAGGFYIQSPEDNIDWAEFIYDFRPNALGIPEWKEERHLCLKVTANYGHNPIIYSGPFASFDFKKAEKMMKEEFKDE